MSGVAKRIVNFVDSKTQCVGDIFLLNIAVERYSVPQI